MNPLVHDQQQRDPVRDQLEKKLKKQNKVKQSELKWTLIHQVDQRVIKACRVCK